MFKTIADNWKWGAFFRNLSVMLLLFLIVVIILYERIFVSIAPGEVGVEYDFLEGTKMHKVYEDGLNVISPFNRIIKYSSRVQTLKFDQEVLTQDGLIVKINHEILYQINTEYCPICRTASLPKLHVTLGPNYAETLIKPNALSYLIFGIRVASSIKSGSPFKMFALISVTYLPGGGVPLSWNFTSFSIMIGRIGSSVLKWCSPMRERTLFVM